MSDGSSVQFEALDGATNQWENRKPKFSRTVGALLKKNFVLKLRDKGTIVQVVIACLIFLLVGIFDNLAKKTHQGSESPPLVNLNASIPSGITYSMMMYEYSKFILLPDNDWTRNVIAPPYDAMWLGLNAISGRSYNTAYKDSIDAMEDSVYESDATGIAINWKNSLDGDRATHPKLEIFVQSLTSQPVPDIIELSRQSFATIFANSGDPNMTEHAEDIRATNWSLQEFATVTKTEYGDISQLLTLFCVLPVILATMPDFQLLLEEKDSKVAALSMLMGCPETAYWLVAFVTPLILSIVPYFIVAASLSRSFLLKGSDFTLLFAICMLFVISHIWFMLAIQTSIKTGSSGRLITILLIVVAMFLGTLHQSFTLDPSNSKPVLKHVFSVVPLSAFQMILMAQYNDMHVSSQTFGWKDLNRDISYPTVWGLIWLGTDAVAYFLIFVIFNALNDRAFGTAPIGWRGLCQRRSWRRLFESSDRDVGRILQATSQMIHVEGLRKVYSTSKDVCALDGISFEIDPGEVIIVIGPNGAGKSTMINILSGAMEPTEGTFSIAGTQSSFRDIQKYLGIVFQDNVIVPLLSVREHLQLFGAFRGIPLEALAEAIDVFGATLQLTEMLDNRAGDLSGGQKRKLCIAMSLLGSPPIVIMDEPTAGVDVQARQIIWKTIASLHETTTIVTSHALEEAEAVSSRLFIVSKGKLPFCGTSTQLRSQFKCGYLLKIARDDGTTGEVLSLAQRFVPDAHLVEDRTDTIGIPVDDSIPAFLAALSQRQRELGVTGYSFAVEQLEDMLLRLIESDEAQVERS